MIELFNNEIIEAVARQNPNTAVVKSATTSLSNGELLQDSQRLAEAMAIQGFKTGDRAVIAVQPGIEFVKIIFAAMMLRLQLAIIDPEMGRDNYKNKLEQFNPQWVFIDSRLLLLQEHPILRYIYFQIKKNGLYFPTNRNIKKIVTGPRLPIFQKHISFRKLIQGAQLNTKLSPSAGSFDFLTTYTSGTTTAPKGVVHTLETLSKSISIIVRLLKSEHSQAMATHLPHFMLIGICAGISVKLWKESLSAQEKIDFINQHQITTLFAPPAEYLQLIQYCEKENCQLPICLSHLLIGSAPVHRSFLVRLARLLTPAVKITCLYGMTENLVVSTVDGWEKINYPCQGDLLGTPVAGVQIKIAADNEILIQSDQLFKKYLHLENNKGWHATGDLGRMDENGMLILIGRKKEMIIRRNFNLYPALYEPTIKKIQGIEEAAIIGIYDESIADERVVLVLETSRPIEPGQVRKKIERGKYSIDREAWPDSIVLRKVPRKGRQQKIDRQQLMHELSQSII